MGSMNVQEVYHAEDFIEEVVKGLLQIDVSEYTIVSDGSISYTILLVSDLDTDQEEALTQIGFVKNMNGDLWIIQEQEFNITKFKNALLPFLTEFQRKHWKKLFEQECSVAYKLHEKIGISLFLRSYVEVGIILRWDGKLIWTADEFSNFVQNLNTLFRDNQDNLQKKVRNWLSQKFDFLKDLGLIRNFHSHDFSDWSSTKVMKLNKALIKYVGENWQQRNRGIHFLRGEMKLLGKGLNFIEELEEALDDDMFCDELKNISQT